MTQLYKAGAAMSKIHESAIMRRMKTLAGFFIGFTCVVLPLAASADTVSQLSIGQDGIFSGKNILVFQKSGTNLFARATWGQAFVRLTLLLNASSSLNKLHGEKATVDDINDGDLIDVDGRLSAGADSLVISVDHLRDGALVKESKTLSGTITSVDPVSSTLVLSNKQFGKTTVYLTATTTITKGARTITFSEVKKGDQIISVSGTYDFTKGVLAAQSVVVYQDLSIFKPQNYQGTVKSVSAITLPTTMIVTVGTTDYAVSLSATTTLLSKTKTAAVLNRFMAGDSVRIFGAVRQTDMVHIDAEVVRDLNF